MRRVAKCYSEAWDEPRHREIHKRNEWADWVVIDRNGWKVYGGHMGDIGNRTTIEWNPQKEWGIGLSIPNSNVSAALFGRE